MAQRWWCREGLLGSQLLFGDDVLDALPLAMGASHSLALSATYLVLFPLASHPSPSDSSYSVLMRRIRLAARSAMFMIGTGIFWSFGVIPIGRCDDFTRVGLRPCPNLQMEIRRDLPQVSETS